MRYLLLIVSAIGMVSSVFSQTLGQDLTPADVLGPDGIVYPNWKWVGVEGGIPDVPVKAESAEYGAFPDDDLDDADALEKGLAAVGAMGGGALLVGEGVYKLSRPVVCDRDGVVLRGMGPEKTKFIFDYALLRNGITFFKPAPNSTIYANTWVEIHCKPDGLKAIAVYVGDRRMASRTKREHWGGTFSLRIVGSSLLRSGKSGAQTLRAVAEFEDGTTAEATLPVVFASRLDRTTQPTLIPRYLGAITFVGERATDPKHELAADAHRGDTKLHLRDAGDLKPGDIIIIEAPATERWNRMVKNKCEWGTYRRNEYRIASIRDNTITIGEPLRIPFPTVDGSHVRRYRPIQRCGVENFSLEQTQKLWTSGVIFSNAWNCWARNVHVKKAGRWPVYTSPAKHCEIRDCYFDDAWYHGGGGTAYVGFEMAYDCLLDNVRTRKMRHAPCVQWSASGNVIRSSTFIQSDGQWHAGWTNENLFENCVIDAKQGTGAYGHGFWASPPEDKAHGPNGPRNVVWGCDVVSPKAGIWMGGMNSGWLILYNRIVCNGGPGVFMKTNSDDHLIANNVILLSNSDTAAFTIQTEDCDRIRVENNFVFGGLSTLFSGKGSPALKKGNRHEPLTKRVPPAPRCPVKSIFEWQRSHR